jgi:hypothetical protein
MIDYFEGFLVFVVEPPLDDDSSLLLLGSPGAISTDVAFRLPVLASILSTRL